MKSTLLVCLALTCSLPAWAGPPASAPANGAVPRAPEPPLAKDSRILARGFVTGRATFLVFTGSKLEVWTQGIAYDIKWEHVTLPTGHDDIGDTQAGSLLLIDGPNGARFATFVTAEGMNKHKGGIFRSTDGKVWTRVAKVPAQAVAFLDPMNGVALGNPGVNGPARTMGLTHDGGKSWRFVDVEEADPIVEPADQKFAKNRSIWCQMITAENEAIAYATHDAGKTWHRLKETSRVAKTPAWTCWQD